MMSTVYTLAVSADRAAMFPSFSAAARKLLLLPVATATVGLGLQRSFLTMNHILCSQRCRLLPEHSCQLMQMPKTGFKILGAAPPKKKFEGVKV